MTSASPKTSSLTIKGDKAWASSVAPLVSKGVTGTQEGSIVKIFIGVAWASEIIYSSPVVPATLAISWGSVIAVVTPWSRDTLANS